MADDIPPEVFDNFDADVAIFQIKKTWVKLGFILARAAASPQDWVCDDPANAALAMQWAAQAEACFWRATGDCEAIDADRFIPALAPLTSEQSA